MIDGTGRFRTSDRGHCHRNSSTTSFSDTGFCSVLRTGWLQNITKGEKEEQPREQAELELRPPAPLPAILWCIPHAARAKPAPLVRPPPTCRAASRLCAPRSAPPLANCAK